MKTTSVKGTKDFLPKELELRENVKNIIENTYREYGYNKISTPIIEDIENLENSDGGDNIKLIFKILKRGDKLEASLEKNDYKNLADLGLRYDLTLPLTRFYAEHREKLPKPFKVIQIDRVYRADRPQKGRMREFMQCDIDVIGSDNYCTEVELILVTMKALQRLGLGDIEVKISSRKTLFDFLSKMGYSKDEIPEVCICFDKLDKIGIDGVYAELCAGEFNKDANEKFYEFLKNKQFDYNGLADKENVDNIIEKVKKLSGDSVNINFDISLVRGQGYYTGTIFELYSKEFSQAVGGGGRYDNLIGKFIGENVPAVGFSIGFERICSILNEKNFETSKREKIAVLYDEENFIDRFNFAESLRQNYIVSMFENPKKLGKMLDKLQEIGYIGFVSNNATNIKYFDNSNM